MDSTLPRVVRSVALALLVALATITTPLATQSVTAANETRPTIYVRTYDSANDDSQWRRVFGDDLSKNYTKEDAASHIEVTHNGVYITYGTPNKYLRKYHHNGTVAWTKTIDSSTYGGIGAVDIARGFGEIPDRLYLGLGDGYIMQVAGDDGATMKEPVSTYTDTSKVTLDILSTNNGAIIGTRDGVYQYRWNGSRTWNYTNISQVAAIDGKFVASSSGKVVALRYGNDDKDDKLIATYNFSKQIHDQDSILVGPDRNAVYVASGGGDGGTVAKANISDGPKLNILWDTNVGTGARTLTQTGLPYLGSDYKLGLETLTVGINQSGSGELVQVTASNGSIEQSCSSCVSGIPEYMGSSMWDDPPDISTGARAISKGHTLTGAWVDLNGTNGKHYAIRTTDGGVDRASVVPGNYSVTVEKEGYHVTGGWMNVSMNGSDLTPVFDYKLEPAGPDYGVVKYAPGPKWNEDGPVDGEKQQKTIGWGGFVQAGTSEAEPTEDNADYLYFEPEYRYWQGVPDRAEFHVDGVEYDDEVAFEVETESSIYGAGKDPDAYDAEIHLHSLSGEDALVYRGDEPIPRVGSNAQGSVDQEDGHLVINTETQDDGTLELAIITNPSTLQQVQYQAAVSGSEGYDFDFTEFLDGLIPFATGVPPPAAA